MKKLLFAIIASLVIVLAACGGNGSEEGGQTVNSTLQKIQKNKKLVVGTAPGYFPFEMKNTDGEFIGYDVDLANAMGKWLGVDVEFKQFVFDGLTPALQAGEVDMIIAGLTIRGDRALAVSLSQPYYTAGQAILLPGDDNATKSWEDLDVKGKKVAVGVGTTGAILAQDIFKNAEVMVFDDFPLAATAMGQGQADAVLYDEPAIAVWKAQQGDNVKVLPELLSKEKLGIAVQKNDFETIQWINSFLDSYVDSPEELTSREKWFDNSDWLNEVDEE